MMHRQVSRLTILKTKVIRSLPKLRPYIIFIFLLILIYFLLQTNLFNITEVEVVSVDGKVTESIDTDTIKSIKSKFEGVNYVSAKAVLIKEVADGNSYIESYWIEKALPNKVKVVIKEREPKYFVKSEDNALCAILDSSAYTIESGNSKEECDELSEVPALSTITVSPLPTFVSNTQSSFLYLINIEGIEKVLDNYGYRSEGIKIIDGVCTISIQNERYITLSFNQDLKIQLARFVVVAEDIKVKNVDFSYLDLRYERPVIKGE